MATPRINPAETNPFERRARMFLARADEGARAIAELVGGPPANSAKLSTDDLARLWHQSPSPTPDADFWLLHDQLVAGGMPPAQAEPTALAQVYPMREKLYGSGVRSLDDQVSQANEIVRLIGAPRPTADVAAAAMATPQDNGPQQDQPPPANGAIPNALIGAEGAA